MHTHEHYMRRAIELAKRAQGHTSPNPLVGALVVLDGCTIGEGWHEQAGSPHAEVNAINVAFARLKAEHGGDETISRTLLSRATLYVSLEPCCHHGKTPPCTDAILNAGIKTVVYATDDTNTNAKGGADLLRDAGVIVLGHVCEEQARYVNRFFFHFQKYKTPYVIAKFASSLDGRTATRTGNSQWITGQTARDRGHTIRQAVDAIVVGANTAIADEPQLTVRNHTAHPYSDPAHPLRVVLDTQGRVPASNSMYNPDLPGKTLLVTTDQCSKEHIDVLTQQGVDVLQQQGRTVDIAALLKELANRNVQSLLIEGGHSVLGSFTDAQLINEVWAFLAPTIIGGEKAMASVGGTGVDQLSDALTLTHTEVEQLGRDILVRGLVEPAPKRIS